jgi:hypothetical protein
LREPGDRSHPLIDLMKKVRTAPGIKKVFIASGALRPGRGARSSSPSWRDTTLAGRCRWRPSTTIPKS